MIVLGLLIVGGAAVIRCMFECLRWVWRMVIRNAKNPAQPDEG